MRTGPASTTTPSPGQAKTQARGTKANGRDHAGAPLNGAGTSAGPQEAANNIDCAGAAPTTAEDLAKAAEATAKGGAEIRAGDYGTRNGCLIGFKQMKEAEVPFKLCNFTARITHELHTDQGLFYRLEARLFDKSVRHLILTPTEFSNPRRWVAERIGARASITVGQDARVSAAIEAISREIGFIEETAAIATGYTMHRGSPMFVAPNRIIALPGVDTSTLILHLPAEVQRYSLAEPPVGQAAIDALQAAARIPAIGKLSVILPLFLQAFRAAIPYVPPAAYVVWPHGLTGTLKSSVSAVCLNFFGRRWHYRELTGTFLDTKASVEAAIHYPRGMLAVLDDAVGDSRRGAEAVAGVVGFVLRAVGNGTGRGRYKSDLTRQPTRDPQAAVIVNAEGQPPGGSGSAPARALTVHVTKGDIDLGKLSQAQADGSSGLLEAAMSVFIQAMLSQDRDQFAAAFEANRIRYRDQVTAALRGTGVHGRTADAVGDLMATAEVVVEVFGQHGVTLPFDIAEALSVLTGSGGAHTATIANSEPIEMFRRTLRELIEGAQVQIGEVSTGRRPAVNDGAWGWPRKPLDPSRIKDGGVVGHAHIESAHAVGVDVSEVYLRRGATYAVVLDALRKAGETLGLNLNSMWAALIDRGLVIPGTDKSAVLVRVNGAQQRLMRCKVEILSEDDSDAAGGAREVEEVPDPDDPY
jgi:hypothetical protein